MVCPFELLHFVPLALIAGTALFARKKYNRITLSLAVASLSVIGLISGSHVHTAHAEPLTLLDPCVGYFVALIASAGVLVKALAKKEQFSK